MSKKMPITDFRAVRTVLEASDFAIAPRPRERLEKDLIDHATWEDIQTLPETVAIFTSNDHGTQLSLLSTLWGCWVETFPIDGLPLSKKAVVRASFVAADEFQAATFNALHGFYRTVADCLRSAVEQMTTATSLELRGNDAEIQSWLDGEQQFLFSSSCQSLRDRFPTTRLRRLFQQDDGKNKEGWIRSFHRALSDYAHGRPGFDASKMWEGSNGPIYVTSAFLWSVKMWLFAYAACVILLKLSRPELVQVGDIFSRQYVCEMKELKSASEALWSESVRTV
ncbi:MAG TPA: hypothetical protein VMU53_18200 [Candidatus Sulfotelmatobacter sp.]|nr:hypothetical protein [Candidatus Sulfotelmatobacter sp.]